MQVTECSRVTLQYIAEEDRLKVQLVAANQCEIVYVTARLMNVLVQRWFSHPDCQISEALWLRQSIEETSVQQQHAIFDQRAASVEKPKLLTTVKLRVEKIRTLIQFEIAADTIWALPLDLDSSIRFLRALRKQYLIAQWSLHGWPAWLQTVDSRDQMSVKVAIH